MKPRTKSLIIAPVLLVAAALCLSCQSKTDYIGDISKDPGALDEKDREAVRHIMRITKVGEQTDLNFANDLHYRYYKRLLYQAGLTEETNPQLFNVLESTRREHVAQAAAMTGDPGTARDGSFRLTSMPVNSSNTATVPIEEITSFSSTSQGTHYATSALLSFPQDIAPVTATILVGLYKQNGEQVGNVSVNSGYTPQQLADLQVGTGGTATSPYDSIYSMFTYFYQLRDGSTRHAVKKAYTSDVVDTVVNMKPMTCMLGHTVPGCGSGTCTQKATSIVTVCMTRQTPDCNYCNSGLSNNLIFPMEGYIKYKGDVNVGPNGKPTGGFNSITLTRLPAGGGCPAIPLSGNFLDYVTVTGDSLYWNIDQAHFQNNCLASGDSVLFQMTLLVFVRIGPNLEPAYATISNAADAQPPSVKIPKIQIVSGCLAAGTEIVMANGKEKKIEEIAIGEKVISNAQNRPLTVDYSTIGRESKPCLRIDDSKDHSILVTDAHPMITPTGVVLARDLKIGDSVVTRDGVTEIVAIANEQHDGEVWNLSVGGNESDGLRRDFTNSTFYANGFLVGDHKMQSHHQYNRQLSRNEVLQRLPEEWHKDFLNTKN